MPSLGRARKIRSNDAVRIHLTLWLTLILLALLAGTVQIRISLPSDVRDNAFLQALVDAFDAWLVGTLPILLAGGFAIAMATRRGRMLLPACLVLGSAVVEMVGYAAWSAFSTSSSAWPRQAVYALSAVLLAAAWLAARGGDRSGLLASPFAGLASWFAVPHLTAALYRQAQTQWGSGTAGQFVGLAACYALEVLVFSIPAITLIILRSPQATDERSSASTTSSPADSRPRQGHSSAGHADGT